MGLEELKAQIISDANKKAEEIKTNAKLKAQEITKEAEERAEEIKEEGLRKAEEDARAVKARIIGEAKLEARKSLLFVKQEIIEKVIKKALAEISEMPDREYLEFLESRLLSILAAEKLEGKCIIELSEKDRKRIPKDWLEQLEKKLKIKNLKLELGNNFRKDFTGGFVLKTPEVEINNSLEAIVKFKIDLLEQEIAKILFE
ncbi:MAG: V-type ATP synthase subunit E [Candidatus Thermoplasmatota archaeon]|nr:V-type ATP synthase subunit E [Candidatus Thermoplasmatota archaeon]MDI6855489.1 V-type ATP synthase subunit E [Candidatus Thermoplasmatota archaeon]